MSQERLDLSASSECPTITPGSHCSVRGCSGIILADTDDWPAPLCAEHAPRWLPSAAAAPLAKLIALIPSELRSVTFERANAGKMTRVTCVRVHGSPLTTLHSEPDIAVHLAVEELSC